MKVADNFSETWALSLDVPVHHQLQGVCVIGEPCSFSQFTFTQTFDYKKMCTVHTVGKRNERQNSMVDDNFSYAEVPYYLIFLEAPCKDHLE